jgi:hypothetical protein
MEEKRSWWQQIKKYRVTILVVAIILIIAIVLIIVGYRYNWTGLVQLHEVVVVSKKEMTTTLSICD